MMLHVNGCLSQESFLPGTVNCGQGAEVVSSCGMASDDKHSHSSSVEGLLRGCGA